MRKDTERVLLTEKQACHVVKLETCTLQKRRCLGLPPRFLKIGRKVYYDQRDLDDFLDSCVKEKTSNTKKHVDKICLT